MQLLRLLCFAFAVLGSSAFAPVNRPLSPGSLHISPQSVTWKIHSGQALQQRRRPITIALSNADEPPADNQLEEEEEEGKGKVGIWKRITSYFRGGEKDDGLTFKERLAKMGLATVLSYGWISNTNAMILVAAAWYVFSVKVRGNFRRRFFSFRHQPTFCGFFLNFKDKNEPSFPWSMEGKF